MDNISKGAVYAGSILDFLNAVDIRVVYHPELNYILIQFALR